MVDKISNRVAIHQETSELLLKLKANGIDKYYRVGVSFCPHCNFNAGWDIRPDPWYTTHMKEIILDEPRMSKVNGAIIICECPKCMEYSWHHVALTHLKSLAYLYGHIDYDTIVHEIERRKKMYEDIWKTSPCNGCNLVIKDEFTGYRHWINCGNENTSRHGSAEKKGYQCEMLKGEVK